MVPSVVFTSDNACHQHARRLLESQRGAFKLPMAEVMQVVEPLVREVATKGKLRRGDLFPRMRRAYERINAIESVIDCRFISTTESKLSANEGFEVSYLQTSNFESNRRASEILHGCLTMDRRTMRLTNGTTRFIVAEHALVRYMRRHRKAPDTFFKSLLPALQLSTVLAPFVISQEHNEIALPLDDGLLLGYAYYMETKPGEEHSEMVYEITQDGLQKPHIGHRAGLVDCSAIQVEIITYLDNDTLLPVKEELRDRLQELYRDYQAGISGIFDAIACNRRGRASNAEIEAAADASKDMVFSQIWQRYLGQRALAKVDARL